MDICSPIPRYIEEAQLRVEQLHQEIDVLQKEQITAQEKVDEIKEAIKSCTTELQNIQEFISVLDIVEEKEDLVGETEESHV